MSVLGQWRMTRSYRARSNRTPFFICFCKYFSRHTDRVLSARFLQRNDKISKPFPVSMRDLSRDLTLDRSDEKNVD